MKHPGIRESLLYSFSDSTIIQPHMTMWKYTVHCAQYTVHSAQYTVHSAQCTVHSAQCTVHSAQCTVHSAQYTVHTDVLSGIWPVLFLAKQ